MHKDHEDYDLNAYVDGERAKGTSDEDLATQLEEKLAKKEAMVEELRAKIDELRGASAEDGSVEPTVEPTVETTDSGDNAAY